MHALQEFNYNSFPEAWLTTFQISSADQWMTIMWSIMQLTWVSLATAVLGFQDSLYRLLPLLWLLV